MFCVLFLAIELHRLRSKLKDLSHLIGIFFKDTKIGLSFAVYVEGMNPLNTISSLLGSGLP